MANTALVKKLKIKEGLRVSVLNAPEGYVEELGALPEGATLEGQVKGQYEVIQVFVRSSKELAQDLPKARKALKEGGSLWISFPKKSSKVQTDLSRDQGWEPLEQAGLRPVSLISVDETWSAMQVREAGSSSEEEIVAAQYAGKKEALRPIYERLVDAAEGFGKDVELAPRKTYVGLMRKNIFAVIKASTATRVDLGLKLKGKAGTERLVEAPGFGSGAITHKVAITSLEEVDGQVEVWLREAYEGVG